MFRARWLALGLTLMLFVPSAVRADEMDIDLNDLRRDELSGGEEFAWKRLMSQLGGTIAPPVLEPANTVGPGGFYLGVEGAITGIDDDQLYWGYGTEGDDPSEALNRFTKPTYSWFRMNVRKGLPFGFELGASAAHAMHTNYWAWGVTLKWAILEGFRTGIGYLPDLAFRASVQTMTGDSEFNLTVPSADLILSKPIVLAKTATLTPYVAGQAMFVLADSEVVDLTPGTNPYDVCQPQAPFDSQARNQAAYDDSMDPLNDPDVRNRSTFACSQTPPTGSEQFDFENNHVFSQIRAMRTRLVFGMQYQYMALTLNASFGFDLVKPGQLDDDVVSYVDDRGTESPDDDVRVTNEGFLPRQWTAAFGVGFTY